MGTLRLKGKVVHMPGSWGPNVPAENADVQIIDLDMGNPSDTIWTGRTGIDGVFQGTSSEWKDRVPIKVWRPKPPFGGEWVIIGWQDDPTDVLLLQAKISQGSNQTTLPFAFVADDVMSPPLVVPWGPPDRVIGKVNDVACRTPDELYGNIKGAVDAGTSPINIQIYGPDAETLSPVALPPNELRQWVNNRYGYGIVGEIEIPTAVWIILAIAALCLAIGASIALVILALAVLYAVHKNYKGIQAQMCPRLPTGEVCFNLILTR